MAILSDYLLKTTGAAGGNIEQPFAGVFVQMVNNVTGIAYVSDTVTDSNGKYTFSVAQPPPGVYTLNTGPTGSAPWTPTGDTNYPVALTSNPWFDVSHPSFAGGAKLNNSANDTAAINAAGLAANAAGGGIVFIPPGTGIYNATLNQYSNVTFMGTGPASTLKKTASASFSGSGLSNVRFINIRFDGNSQGFNVIHFDNCTNCLVDGCYIINSLVASAAVNIQNGSTLCRVSNSYISGCSGGVIIQLGGGAASTSNSVVGCVITALSGATSNAVWIRDIGCNGNLVEGCVLLGGGSTGSGVTVGSGLCIQNRIVGNYCQGMVSQSGILCNGTGNTVTGNVCVGNNIDGIDLGNASFCTVTGNYCYGNSLNGIEINAYNGGYASRGHTVTGNVCQANSKATLNGWDGIVIQSANGQPCQDHILIGNRCFDDSGVQMQRWGINEIANGAVVDNNLIVGNNVRGNLTGGLKITGPNTQAGLNLGSGYLTRSIQTIAYAAAITPDAAAAEIVVVGVLTGSITINAPLNPVKGAFLTFVFTQNGGGFNTVTWNAVFKGAFNPHYAGNRTSSVTWFYDGTNWQIYQGVAVNDLGNAYIGPGGLTVNGTIQGFAGIQAQAGFGFDTSGAGTMPVGATNATLVAVTPSTSFAKDIRRSRQTPTEAVLVSGVDATAGELISVTLTAARVVGAPLNPFIGQRLTFILIQGGAGAFAVTWNVIFKKTWSDVGNAAGARSTISYVYDGANWDQDGAQAPYV